MVSPRWRRIAFIASSGDRFLESVEINGFFERGRPAGRLCVSLKEMGIQVEQEWLISEVGIEYVVDLASPVEDGWLPVTFGDHPGPLSRLPIPA